MKFEHSKVIVIYIVARTLMTFWVLETWNPTVLNEQMQCESPPGAEFSDLGYVI